MPANRPQYYRNELDSLKIDKATLLNVLKEFQSAVIHGTQLIQSNCPVPDISKYGSIFSGTPGISFPGTMHLEVLNSPTHQVLLSHFSALDVRLLVLLVNMNSSSPTFKGLRKREFFQHPRSSV
jgi:hypothetical protein